MGGPNPPPGMPQRPFPPRGCAILKGPPYGFFVFKAKPFFVRPQGEKKRTKVWFAFEYPMENPGALNGNPLKKKEKKK